MGNRGFSVINKFKTHSVCQSISVQSFDFILFKFLTEQTTISRGFKRSGSCPFLNGITYITS